MKAVFSILFVLVCIFCNAQVGGSAVDYSQLSAADKQQRTVDSLAYVAQKRADSITVAQNNATVANLLTLALSTLNGMKPPTAPTTTQLTAFFYITAYKNNWNNPATGKTDSAKIRQWLSQ